MKFVVYTRVERVVYVVGVAGQANPLADALLGTENRKVHRYHQIGRVGNG